MSELFLNLVLRWTRVEFKELILDLIFLWYKRTVHNKLMILITGLHNMADHRTIGHIKISRLTEKIKVG